MERMIKEELKELEEIKNFKAYVFEGDIYVKAEDFRKKAIECRELKEENKKLSEEIGQLKEELDKAHTAYRAVRKVNKEIMNGYV